MPALTDSWGQLTYFANWFTIGLLAITYPAGHHWGRSRALSESPPDQTTRLDLRGLLDLGAGRRSGTGRAGLQNRQTQTDL